MKVYKGLRTQHGCVVTVDGAPLDPRFDLMSHSAAAFEWGYDGTGPKQLALAILADALGDNSKALSQYKLFAETVIAELKDDEWTLNEPHVRSALDHVVYVPMDLKTLLDRVRGRRT